MITVPGLPFNEARHVVLETVLRHRIPPEVETVALAEACGRVLAFDVPADRDYPAVARSVRDGFAVRAADLPGTFRCIGEVRAGGSSDLEVQSGQAVEIMTGAPVPAGADCVVMIEHCQVTGDQVSTDRVLAPGDHIDPPGSMALYGEVVVSGGNRISYPDVAMLAMVGCTRVPVFEKPRVAILATGDELVPIDENPEPHQIRNSNVHSLAAQVVDAGGEPVILPVAGDEVDVTRVLIEEGLESDLLLLSGGVSAGKYDVVESALATLGAEFLFDRVLIQPGQPLVFGICQEKIFFGLPGNPASTMVCFEVFARAAVELLAGQRESALPLLESRLERAFQTKPGLTRFLPARLSADGASVTPVRWQGSGDIPALARANCFLVTDPEMREYAAGDRIRVMLR
jgi:molybdopterin molybdotransferase